MLNKSFNAQMSLRLYKITKTILMVVTSYTIYHKIKCIYNKTYQYSNAKEGKIPAITIKAGEVISRPEGYYAD